MDLEEKLKKLKHVQVYDQIYQAIQDGTYPPGSQLPSEPELAGILQVSRMTLRKALALLQEDKLVINLRGIGNFVREKEEAPEKSLNHYGLLHPFHDLMSLPIQEVELEWRLDLPTQAMKDALEAQVPALAIIDRWYHTQDGPKAYTLSYIPIDLVSAYGLDLQDNDQLRQFLQEEVYNLPQVHMKRRISFTHTGNFTASKYQLETKADFILIQESLHHQGRVVLFNKHYLAAPYLDWQYEIGD